MSSNQSDLEVLHKLVRERQVEPIYQSIRVQVAENEKLGRRRCYRHAYAEVRWELVDKLNELAAHICRERAPFQT